MNKKKLYGAIGGVLLLVIGSSAYFLSVSQEEENFDVSSAPPGISIDTGYNATLSGEPFYIVSQEEADMFEAGPETCERLGGESDRQNGWYTVTAYEDGMTVEEVVFEQADYSEGNRILVVYYNSEDKTFEALPNRIIKSSDGGNLPLLELDKELQKGDVVVLNSNVSVDFCNNYREAAGHDNYVNASWNLLAKPDFSDLGYRSIWSVDFSGENLEQFYRESGSDFNPDTLSNNDLYWIYASENSVVAQGGELPEQEVATNTEPAESVEPEETDNENVVESEPDDAEPVEATEPNPVAAQIEGNLTSPVQNNLQAMEPNLTVGTQETNETEGTMIMNPDLISGSFFDQIDFSQYQIQQPTQQIELQDRFTIGTQTSEPERVAYKGTVLNTNGDFVTGYTLSINYVDSSLEDETLRPTSASFNTVLESSAVNLSFSHPDYATLRYVFSEIDSPQSHRVEFESRVNQEIANLSGLSSGESVVDMKVSRDDEVWLITRANGVCASFNNVFETPTGNCLYKQIGNNFKMVSAKIRVNNESNSQSRQHYDLVRMEDDDYFVWTSQAKDGVLFYAGSDGVSKEVTFDSSENDFEELLHWSYNPVLGSIHFVGRHLNRLSGNNKRYVGQIYETNNALKMRKTRYSSACIHRDSGLNQQKEISNLVGDNFRVISMGDGVWVHDGFSNGAPVTYMIGDNNDKNADFICAADDQMRSMSINTNNYGLDYSSPKYAPSVITSASEIEGYFAYNNKGTIVIKDEVFDRVDDPGYKRMIFGRLDVRFHNFGSFLNRDFFYDGNDFYLSSDYKATSGRTVYDIYDGKKIEYGGGKVYQVSL